MLALDANLWIAPSDPADVFHGESVAVFIEAARRGLPLAGPSFVVLESICALARRVDTRPESGASAAAVAWRSGRLLTMKGIPVADLLELPVAERIRLVELLWDSIAAVPEAISIPEEWKAELNRRLADFEADPEAGSPWEEVRSRILQRAWRSA